ncbi:MAG: hypothetical protein JWM28_284 [Chitinophagaceae bacterium]|nr:hypothetical protein [Chitinophagaceae bacterium]
MLSILDGFGIGLTGFGGIMGITNYLFLEEPFVFSCFFTF